MQDFKMPTLSESITTRKFNQFLRKHRVKHLSESYELTITYGLWKFYRPTDTLNYGKIILKSTNWFTTNTQKSKCKSTQLIPYNWHLTTGVFKKINLQLSSKSLVLSFSDGNTLSYGAVTTYKEVQIIYFSSWF